MPPTGLSAAVFTTTWALGPMWTCVSSPLRVHATFATTNTSWTRHTPANSRSCTHLEPHVSDVSMCCWVGVGGQQVAHALLFECWVNGKIYTAEVGNHVLCAMPCLSHCVCSRWQSFHVTVTMLTLSRPQPSSRSVCTSSRLLTWRWLRGTQAWTPASLLHTAPPPTPTTRGGMHLS